MNWLQFLIILAGVSALVLYILIAVALVVCIIAFARHLTKRRRK